MKIQPCVMTLQPKQKMHLGENSTFGPIHDATISLHRGRYGIEAQIDSFSGDGSKSWVVISRELDTHVSEMSVGCKQSMYPETATQQVARSGAERSVPDMTFATRSKVKAAPTRSSEPSSPPVKLPPDTSPGQQFCSTSGNSVSSSEPGGKRFFA